MGGGGVFMLAVKMPVSSPPRFTDITKAFDNIYNTFTICQYVCCNINVNRWNTKVLFSFFSVAIKSFCYSHSDCPGYFHSYSDKYCCKDHDCCDYDEYIHEYLGYGVDTTRRSNNVA